MLYKFSSFGVQKPKLHREHRGTIINVDDPEKLGRVQVEVPGIYNKSDKDNLPWVYPEQPYEHSGHEKEANIHVPRLGSTVTIKFTNGSQYHPFYTSSWRSKNNTALEPFKDNYPYTSGTVTRNGNQTLHNLKDGSTVYKHYAIEDDPNSDQIDEGDSTQKMSVSHHLKATQPSDGNSEDQGQQPKFVHGIDAQGSVSTTGVKDSTTVFQGDTKQTTGGDKTDSVNGKSTMTALKDMVLNTAQNMLHTAGNDINHTASSQIKNIATKILLN